MNWFARLFKRRKTESSEAKPVVTSAVQKRSTESPPRKLFKPFESISLSPSHYAFVRGVTVSLDGQYIASCSVDKKFIAWNSETLSKISEYHSESRCGAVAISSDNNLVATAIDGGCIQVFAVQHGSLKFSSNGLTGLGFCVRFSPDNRFVAWTTFDSSAIGVVDIKKGKFCQKIDLPGYVTASMIDFNPAGNILGAMCSDGSLRLFEFGDSFNLNKKIDIRGAHSCKPSLCRFIKDGKKIVCATRGIYIIDLKSEETEEFSVSDDYFSLDLAIDESILAGGTVGGRLGIYDFPSSKELFKGQADEGQIFSVACAPDGRFVVSSGSDGAVKVWPVKQSIQTQVVPLEDETKLGRLLRGIEETPQWAYGHCRMGMEYIDLGNLEDAISHFEEAVRLSPESKDVNDAYKYLAIIYEAKGEHDKAGQASAGDKRTDPHRNVGGTRLVTEVVNRIIALVQKS